MRKCAACAAKDQTITLLADLVDWHRAQIGPHMQSASNVVSPPQYVAHERMWVSEDEEDIEAAVERGMLSTEAAERALASIQALNQTVTVAS